MIHIISEKMLREFWTLYPDAESSLRAWHRLAEQAEWEKFSNIRATYAHADAVGRCVVFNIGGNKYRLVAAIHLIASYGVDKVKRLVDLLG